MNVELHPGDLVTGGPRDHLHLTLHGTMLARKAGTTYWTMRIPRCSIMLVVETHSPSVDGINGVATVLYDGQLVDLFISNIQRLDGTEQ